MAIVDVTAIEALAKQARTCKSCGKVHEYRKFGPGQGGTWADPEDGHDYQPTARQAAEWLESLL